jgi:hypothetical protein
MRIQGENRVKTSVAAADAKPSLKSTTDPKAAKATREDLVDDKPGHATTAPKHDEVNGGRAQKSAMHARMGAIKNAKKELNPKDNPEWFWNGHKKWKTAPEGVEVTRNRDNKDGSEGWIEKWKSPTTGKWIHNYTVAEMEKRAGEKFVKNAKLKDTLPELRAQLARDLRSPEEKTRTIALVVSIIDQTCIRIGNEESTKRSEIKVKEGRKQKEDTYGMTTMLGAFLSKDGTTFTFKGKDEVDHVKTVKDPKLVALLKQLKAKTKDDEPLFPVSAAQVNDYLRPFGAHAHSFRTFHATTMATEILSKWAKAHPSSTQADRAAVVKDVLKPVQEQLGHENIETTLGNYIDPAVVTLFERGKL